MLINLTWIPFTESCHTHRCIFTSVTPVAFSRSGSHSSSEVYTFQASLLADNRSIPDARHSYYCLKPSRCGSQAAGLSLSSFAVLL